MKEQTLKSLAISRASSGKYNEALDAFNSLRKQLIDKYGHDERVAELNQLQVQIATVLTLKGEYDEAFKIFKQALEKMEPHPQEYADDIFDAKTHIAALYSRKMKKDVAGKIYDELRQYIGTLPAGSPKTIELKRRLAMSLKQSGELKTAFDVFTEIYQSRRVIHGETAYVTEYSHADVGIVLLEQGKFREALSILEKVHSTFQIDMFEEISYLRLKRYLADAHMYLGLVKIAEDLYSGMMDAMTDKLPFHPEVLATMHSWGISLDKMNKPEKAICVLSEVYSARSMQSPKHLDTAKTALDIASIHLNQKEYSDAIIAFLNVPAQISNVIKWNPDLLIHSMSCMASILGSLDDTDLKMQVLKTYQHVYQRQSGMRGFASCHKDNLQTRTLVGELLISLQRPQDALEVLKDVLEKRTLVLKNDYTDCIDVLKNIARAYSDLNQRVEAFEFYSEVYEIQKLTTGDNSMEAVNWENQIREVAPESQRTIMIDAVVSNYRTSLKVSTDSDNNVSMEDNSFLLHVASETGRIAMLKFLLFKGAIYNEENSEGKTPVDVACNEAVKNFLNLVHKIFLAVKRVDRESIDQILDIMNDTVLREDSNKEFPLLCVGLDQIRDVIDKTILNARDETGSTPLHLACSNGDAKTVARLLDLEVDRTLKDKSNLSPRDVAADKSFTEILNLLDNYKTKKSQDLEDGTISQKNPEMPEDIMDT